MHACSGEGSALKCIHCCYELLSLITVFRYCIYSNTANNYFPIKLMYVVMPNSFNDVSIAFVLATVEPRLVDTPQQRTPAI